MGDDLSAGEKSAKELGMALGREPTYPIKGLLARAATGSRSSSYNRELKSLVGQGKFNDPRSLKKGSSNMRRKMTPIYLRAAELATMYYSDERDFTAFDDAFD